MECPSRSEKASLWSTNNIICYMIKIQRDVDGEGAHEKIKPGSPPSFASFFSIQEGVLSFLDPLKEFHLVEIATTFPIGL